MEIPTIAPTLRAALSGLSSSSGQNMSILAKADLKKYIRLMPCPFTGPKMFWAGPNFLCQTKNLFTYCGNLDLSEPRQIRTKD